jgi:chromosomal replication initiator protein
LSSFSSGEKRIQAAVSAELEHIWSRVQQELALSVDELTYRIWLAPLRPRELSGQRLLLDAPPHARGWIRDRFGHLLDCCVERVIGEGVTVELAEQQQRPRVEGGEDGARSSRRGSAAQRKQRRVPAVGLPQREPDSRSGPLGNPKLTFEQFVIGDGNRLAHAAALTVAELPGGAYNPLYICGPPGVGKTHLLSAIATLLLAHSPGLTVRCATGESFTNSFIDSLGHGSTEAFKARFRDVDVLLLDDVQFLQRKTKTEEEFFHTFNALHDGGRQIVVTSDRPPNDLQELEDRLRERFSAGLVADIVAPDLPTRVAILHKRAQHDGIAVADEHALQVIAERIEHDVRALEGALIRVVAFSSLTGRELTAELANEVLQTLYPRNERRAGERCSAEEIQAAVAAHYGISQPELLSASRAVRIAWPRQVAMYLARELTDQSLPAIGRDFGGRDHTTVMHACKRAASRIDSDRETREAVDKLRRALHGERP